MKTKSTVTRNEAVNERKENTSMTKPLVNNPDNLITESDDGINLTLVEVTEISEMFYEQYIAVIYAYIETRLLKYVPDYWSLTKSPIYEALMDALEQYEEDPFKDLCIGVSESDPQISAELKVYYGHADEDIEWVFSNDDPDDEDIFTDYELTERHFEAYVYHKFD